MNSDLSVGRALIDSCDKRLFEESVPRFKKALAELNDDEIWHRPNPQSNSPGNLVLHLCGNVRQWIIHALGGRPDRRRRDEEFSEAGPLPRPELLAKLDESMAEAREVILALDPAELAGRRKVQGYDETVADILIHVTEHFSYHTGQLVYLVKAVKGIDMGFYRGVDLSKTGSRV